MKNLHKLILPLIIGSAALLTACHHHDNRRSVPRHPRPGYNYHNSPNYRSKAPSQRHRYNNINDYNNDTLTPYESMW
ncbi:MAG: hypothetical protein Q4F40_05850 [Akkermansia sp.]|nr:hypothetical protein [Akkermansia sp.]